MEIKNAENLAVLIRIIGKHHSLVEDRKGQFSCSLSGNVRLIYEPADDPLPLDENKMLVYSDVQSVVIIEIKDYH